MWLRAASAGHSACFLPAWSVQHRPLVHPIQQQERGPRRQQDRGSSILHRPPGKLRQTCLAQQDSEVPSDADFDWVARNEKQLRALPLAVGGLGVLAIVVNRIFSQGAKAAADAGFEGRAELLATALCAVLLLVGLQWLSVKPRALTQVEPIGKEIDWFDSKLPQAAREEIAWAWQAVQSCSRCRALVVLSQDACLAHLGVCKTDAPAGSARIGVMCRSALKSSKANNLANLARYPGAYEFGTYLPVNTQSVLIQPIGEEGILVMASDYQRGFGRVDQIWAESLAQKLDSALENHWPQNTAELAAAR